jgi:hypothetical protein
MVTRIEVAVVLQDQGIAAHLTEDAQGRLIAQPHAQGYIKGLHKNKPLIKFLSEQGNKALLLKTENYYMQENSKNMHVVTDELFFIIDEKLNSVELTDKG